MSRSSVTFFNSRQPLDLSKLCQGFALPSKSFFPAFLAQFGLPFV